MKTITPFLVLVLVLFLSEINAQNTCANALPITSIPFLSGNQTTCGTGDDYTGTGCANSNYFEGEDFVYELNISNAPVDYFIGITDGATIGNYRSVHVFDGCPDAGGECVGTAIVTGSGAEASGFVSFPSNGIYYLIIDTWPAPNCTSFSLQITGPPENDECPDAIAFPTIATDGTCTTVVGNTALATSSLSGCTGTADDDIWFTFVAPATSILTELTYLSGNGDRVHEIFSGSCDALTSLLCSDNESNMLSGLVVGETYFIRVYSYGVGAFSEFELCIKVQPPPPPNDDCNNAITIGCNQTITGSTTTATFDDIPPCLAASSSVLGVWYELTGTGGDVTLNLCDSDFDTQLAVFTGNCNNLVCLASEDDDVFCTGNNEIITFPSLVGIQYYIFVTGYNANTGNFTLQTECDIVVTNDLAVTAFLAPVNSCSFNAAQVQIEITNEGTLPQSNFEVGYYLNGSTTPETATYNGTLQPSASDVFTFPQTVNLPNVGTHDFEAFSNLTGDQNPINNSLLASVEHLPALSTTIQGNSEVCANDYTLLEVDYDVNYTYEWDTGSNFYIIGVTPTQTTTYTVTVTDTAHPGCIDVASFTINVIPPPEEPVAFASTNVLCQGGSATISVQNPNGNYIWSNGDTGPTITVNQSGFYYVTNIGDGTCSTQSQWVYIGAESAPYVYPQGDGIICGQESETLWVSNGTNFDWSTGENTQSITVMPVVSTSYSVTVTTANNCVYESAFFVTVATDAAPGVVSNMLPPDGAQNGTLPVSFSWSPADNATNYDVYIWNENDPEPSPNNITLTTTQITFSYTGFLQYANTYKWKVRARNACSTEPPVYSAVQKFTLNELPDLVVTTINAPPDAFSGTTLSLSWVVMNDGNGSTNDITNNGTWYDVAYLSPDSAIGGNDFYLGLAQNPNGLLPGISYPSPELETTLPNGLTGNYFVIVCTDRYNNMPESDNQNNCRIEPIPITIQLTPPPDLIVEPVPLVIGAAGGAVFAGETYPITWEVTNRENGTTSGATLSNWWYDRVYLTTDPTLNLQTAQVQATLRHDGNLDALMGYDTSAFISIPANAEDTLYAFVCTDATNREYEYVFENNNCGRSAPLSVIAIPKPDFYINDLTAPATASNNENISLDWGGGNIGADFDGHLNERVYISNQPDFSGWFSQLGSWSTNRNLPNTASYTEQKTVNIPDCINGKHYLLVVTNANNAITEISTDNNLWVDSLVIEAPNLIVSNIDPTPDLLSGQTVTFEWTLSNIGDGDLLGAYVTDRLRIIDANTNTTFTNINSSNNITIFSGDELTRQTTWFVPNGLSGAYLLEVETNYNHNVCENGLFGDNILLLSDTIHVTLADYPNLLASGISTSSSTATAGDAIPFEFTVENNGVGAAIGNWVDNVYLSTEPTWPLTSFVSLGSFSHSQVVTATSGSYEKDFMAQLPTSLTAGTYYLYLQTDAGFSVFENGIEQDNVTRSMEPIEVSVYPSIDLRFATAPVGPVSITPGQSASVFYTVENEGTVSTPEDYWTDGLYLSPNPSWEPSDVLIAEWPYNGGLSAGGSYEQLKNFTVPAGFNSAYYLCLVIDHENAVMEGNEGNNYVKILQSNGDTISVVFPPNPDLTVDTLIAPNNTIAGQPLDVSYTISNIANDGNAIGSWTESIYLSTDLTISSDDVFLGQKNQTVGLNTNESYTDDLTLTLPLGLSGNFYLLLKTDATNLISEVVENNNEWSHYLSVTQPLPGDLMVIKDDIEAPPVDTIATDITISWTLKNNGQNPLFGFMEEGVYLSENETWDAADVYLGKWSGTIGLDPGASTDHSLTARLENVKRQDYYVIVKTDLLDHFLESDETNNCSTGPVPVFIEVPELPIGLPWTPANLEVEQAIYYRIEIPMDTIGETMRVRLAGLNDPMAFNEFYLRQNEIPTRTIHDYNFSAPFEENQEIIVPAVGSGTYYVMAYAVDGLPMQNVELLAEIIPFQITSINTNKGGNTGGVTSLLTGAKFVDGMTVQLDKEGSSLITADMVSVQNGSSAFVTFQLAGVDTGFYNVIAFEGNERDTLFNGFEVTTGTVGNGPLLASCSMNLGGQILTSTNVPDSVDVLFFEPSHPATVRPNQIVPITLRFENTGDVDVPTPTKIFASINGFPLTENTMTIGTMTVDDQEEELSLTFMEENGPENVLRPGGVSFITVYSKAIQSTGALKFKLYSH